MSGRTDGYDEYDYDEASKAARAAAVRRLRRGRRRLFPTLLMGMLGALVAVLIASDRFPDLRGGFSAQRDVEPTSAAIVPSFEAAASHSPGSEPRIKKMETAGLPVMSFTAVAAPGEPPAKSLTALEGSAQPVVLAASPPAQKEEPVAQRHLDESGKELATGSVEPLASRPPRKPVALSPAEKERLTARSTELLKQGDISGARLLLSRAASSGDPQALYALAQTYDPVLLSEWKAVGIRPDKEKARTLYGQALAKGVTEAKARLDNMP